MSRRWSKPNRWIIANTTLTIAAVIAVIFSPLFLKYLNRKDANWSLNADIGQAYGGISAVLASIALLGVVSSLLIQSRQHRLEKTGTIREMQFKIYDLVRENPQELWGVLSSDYVISRPDIERRLLLIQYFQYIWAGYESGLILESNLKFELFPGLFGNKYGREFWRTVSPIWHSNAYSRARRRFIEIADEELEAMEQETPDSILSVRELEQSDTRGRTIRHLAIWIILCCGSLASLKYLRKLKTLYGGTLRMNRPV